MLNNLYPKWNPESADVPLEVSLVTHEMEASPP